MLETDVQSNLTETAVNRTAAAAAQNIVAAPSYTPREKDKRLDKLAETALGFLRAGFANCFGLKDEELPAFLQKEDRKAKLGPFSLWWSNPYTQLDNPDDTFVEADDELALAQNAWFYPYGISMLKRIHAMLSVLKQAAIFRRTDYQADRVGAPTLILFVIKHALLRFSRENPTINSPNITENLAKFTCFLNELANQPKLFEAFQYCPPYSDRTLSHCVEGILEQVEFAQERIFQEKELRPCVQSLESIREIHTNIPGVILEIIASFSLYAPCDFFVYLHQTDERFIHEDVKRFYASAIGKAIKAIYRSGVELEHHLSDAKRLIIRQNQGDNVSEELNRSIARIHRIMHSPFQLRDTRGIPAWFLNQNETALKHEVQTLLNQLVHAYFFVKASQSQYQCMIQVGRGFGELGLIERNAFIVPFLTKTKERFSETWHLFNAISTQTGSGILSGLVRRETLNIRSENSRRLLANWRQTTTDIERKINTYLKKWLEQSLEHQTYVITQLTDQPYLNRIRQQSENADTLVKAPLFNVIFDNEFEVQQDITLPENSLLDSIEGPSYSYNPDFEQDDNAESSENRASWSKAQLELELINTEIQYEEEKRKNTTLLRKNTELSQRLAAVERENRQFRLKLHQVENLSKTLVSALRKATQQYESFVKNMGFFRRLFSSNGLSGVERAKNLERRLLSYLRHANESNYNRLLSEIKDFLQYQERFGGNLNAHSYRTYILSALESVEIETDREKQKLFLPAFQEKWNQSADARKSCLTSVLKTLNDELSHPIPGLRKRTYTMGS